MSGPEKISDRPVLFEGLTVADIHPIVVNGANVSDPTAPTIDEAKKFIPEGGWNRRNVAHYATNARFFMLESKKQEDQIVYSVGMDAGPHPDGTVDTTFTAFFKGGAWLIQTPWNEEISFALTTSVSGQAYVDRNCSDNKHPVQDWPHGWPDLVVREATYRLAAPDESLCLEGSLESTGNTSPPTCPDGFIFVKGGEEFLMGATTEEIAAIPQLQRRWAKDEGPVRRVIVGDLCWSKHEITNKEFETTQSSETKMARDVEFARIPASSGDNKPAVFALDEELQHHCEVAYKQYGGRLPTEAEWEYAAKGPNHTARYPISTETEPTGKQANFDQHHFRFLVWNTNKDNTRDVCSFEEYSVDWPQLDGQDGRICDLAGNVWEVTSDCYTESYPDPNPGSVYYNPRNSGKSSCDRVIRGGAWSNGLEELRSANRREDFSKTWRTNIRGGRCVVPPQDFLEKNERP